MIVPGNTRADKTKDFMGKGRLGGEQEGKGNQKDCSATWLADRKDGISFQVVSGQSF